MAEPSPLLVQLRQVVSPPDRAESNFGATPSVCRSLLFDMRVAGQSPNLRAGSCKMSAAGLHETVLAS
jgi:hypothetical protein